MVRPVLEYGSSVWDPDTKELQDGNRVARFVTRNYVYETGGMTAIIGQLKWESLKKSFKVFSQGSGLAQSEIEKAGEFNG